MNRRIRPQDLQERKDQMRKSPLIRKIDEIDVSDIQYEPWYPGKWKARRTESLEKENRRLQRRLQRIRRYGA